MLITIITPSFNQGAFIEDTIRSVIHQEGDFSIDYIIIDGGSNDSTVDIIKKYSLLVHEGGLQRRCRGIRFRWISEKDKGQVDALEKGFAMSEGDIASWLNSDDVLYDQKVLSRVAEEFRKNNQLDILTADGPLIDKQGREFGLHHVDTVNFDELLYLDYHILQPATFIRRRVYRNERLNRAYHYCFDAEYFIRLISKGYQYKKVDDKYACFRLYRETKTLSGLEKRYAESLRISRIYGHKRLHFIVSAIYKYFDIVVVNKYNSGLLLRKATHLLRRIGYKIITGKSSR